MRSRFAEYYPPTEAQIEHIWSQGLLVPDTSVLLHLFRISKVGQSEIISALKTFGDRLWIPHQVGLEFQRNWRGADHRNRQQYNDLRGKLGTVRAEIKKALAPFEQFNIWPAGSPILQSSAFCDQLLDEVSEALGRLPVAVEAHATITDLLEGKVGDRPSLETNAAREKEFKARKVNKQPPGYMDERPGDYFIWRELMDHANAVQRPVLLLTLDIKEDWWLKDETKPIGPRPELRAEFLTETSQLFYAYSAQRFAEFLAERGESFISPTTIEQMEPAKRDLVDKISNEDVLLGLDIVRGVAGHLVAKATLIGMFFQTPPEIILNIAFRVVADEADTQTDLANQYMDPSLSGILRGRLHARFYGVLGPMRGEFAGKASPELSEAVEEMLFIIASNAPLVMLARSRLPVRAWNIDWALV